ncbi:MAG: CDP-alcohol phosphatidyltransferase family protein [Fimbriimonadaceae bacterium]|nr:CDP-alcohol phosphatidyltransferase family protein [Chitinophagales bacterium]
MRKSIFDIPGYKEKFWTIPNILSLYRMCMFPIILYFLIREQQKVFVTLLIINFITDILDGFIARNFNQRTVIGAKIDSWADIGSYILAFGGIFIFEWNFVVEHKIGLGLFALLYLGSVSTAFIKYGNLVGLHLFSAKIAGYLQGGFLVILLAYGNIEWLFYVIIIVGYWAKIEEIIIMLLLKQKRTDVKGLYWVLKNNW